MSIEEMRVERFKLQAMLGDYRSGKISHFDEDDAGELTRETTDERCASLEKRIAGLDRKIAEARNA